jgi:hypothetical protein
VKLEINKELSLSRIAIEKKSNGMTFARCQVPLRLIYAGTVHRSQGMTLEGAVIDLRSSLWEHGQLYVALSRVTNHAHLCILLPNAANPGQDIDPTETEIRVTVDANIADIISMLYAGVSKQHIDSSPYHSLSFIIEPSGSELDMLIEVPHQEQRNGSDLTHNQTVSRIIHTDL